jgi:hypothetical protein
VSRQEGENIIFWGGYYLQTDIYIYIYICVCVYICVYIYICVCVCIYISLISSLARWKLNVYSLFFFLCLSLIRYREVRIFNYFVLSRQKDCWLLYYIGGNYDSPTEPRTTEPWTTQQRMSEPQKTWPRTRMYWKLPKVEWLTKLENSRTILIYINLITKYQYNKYNCYRIKIH